MENQYFTTWNIIKYFGCSSDFLRNEKFNSEVKLSNKWYFVILIFAILKFRNIGRSIFRRSKFWPHPTAHNSLFKIGEGTLPWAILRFRIFLNSSQKLEKIKITVGNFCLDLYQYYYKKKRFQKNLTFGPRQGSRPLPWAIHLHLYKH